MANPAPTASIAASTSAANIVAPMNCRSVFVKQQDGASFLVGFRIFGVTGSTDIPGSPFPTGAGYKITAPNGTLFLTGQVVGQIQLVAGSAAATFIATAGQTGVDSPSIMQPDVGNGGSSGVCPAPQQGDGALGKHLGADGAFDTAVVTKKVILTSAQLLALQTTAIPLVAGISGYIMVPVKLTLRYKYATTAYTLANSDNQFRLQYIGQTAALIGALAAAGLVDQTANKTLQAVMIAVAAQSDSAISGLGIEIKLAVGTTPALTLGDGTVEVTISYVPVAA